MDELESRYKPKGNYKMHVETISSNLIEMNSTSMFDPVLCEIIYKWYCLTNGKIIDCFVGGVVRGSRRI